VVVIIESLEIDPSAALAVRRCLREVAAGGAEMLSKVFVVATLDRPLRSLGAAELAPFGFIAELHPPQETQRKEFLLRLFQKISRMDARWGSALREAEVMTLASLTSTYSFAEIELVVRRAFIRSTTADGRDPVALHHFEAILSEAPAQAAKAFNDSPKLVQTIVEEEPTKGTPKKRYDKRTKGKGDSEIKDPMDGIFGWCNFWLPEALHLPAVVWAMIIFGILAHFMARSMYQPYGQRKRGRGGGPAAGGRSNSLFGDMSAPGGEFPSFGNNLSDWKFGGGMGAGGMGAGAMGAGAMGAGGFGPGGLGAGFPGFPTPGMGRGGDGAGLSPGMPGSGDAAAPGPTSSTSPPATSSTARPDSSSATSQ